MHCCISASGGAKDLKFAPERECIGRRGPCRHVIGPLKVDLRRIDDQPNSPRCPTTNRTRSFGDEHLHHNPLLATMGQSRIGPMPVTGPAHFSLNGWDSSHLRLAPSQANCDERPRSGDSSEVSNTGSELRPSNCLPWNVEISI